MNQKTRILIVEDDALSALTLQNILEKWGYEVCKPVATGAEAIKSVEKEQPEVVLMDIRLVGGMDGIETAWEIRSFSEAAIIFITGYSDEDVIERTKVLNPVAYLLKPVRMPELKLIIHSAISGQMKTV